jgi:hypothetical protein
VDIIASADATIDDDKYSTSKNPSTGLYYRLHILNVGVYDVKKYRCQGLVNGVSRAFYLKLDLLGRCSYIFIIFKVRSIFDNS